MTPFTTALARVQLAQAEYAASPTPRNLMALEDALAELRRAHDVVAERAAARVVTR